MLALKGKETDPEKLYVSIEDAIDVVSSYMNGHRNAVALCDRRRAHIKKLQRALGKRKEELKLMWRGIDRLRTRLAIHMNVGNSNEEFEETLAILRRESLAELVGTEGETE